MTNTEHFRISIEKAVQMAIHKAVRAHIAGVITVEELENFCWEQFSIV